MSAHVISHQWPGRKRERTWRTPALQIAALLGTVLALTATAWLAQTFGDRDETAPAPVRPPAAQSAPPQMRLPTADIAADLAVPAPQRRVQRARRGVPLNAAPETVPDGYEILSASELDAISQARD